MQTDPAVPRRTSVSRSLQFLAVGLLALILGLTTVRMMALREAVVDNARQQMARLDMVFAEQTGRAVETVDFIMREIAEQMEAGENRPASDTLRRRITGVRQIAAVMLTDADGHIVLSSRPGEEVLPPAGLTLLTRLREQPSPTPLISEPIRDADGRWTALMARRRPSATFSGLVIGVINLGYFEEFYKAVDLTENGAIILHHRDGTALARYPAADQIIGTNFADLPPFRDVLSHEIAGSVEMISPVDGSLRILAIRALRAFPLAVNVSVDVDRVLASWRRQTLGFGAAVMAAGLLIVGLMLLLARRSREIERLLTSYAGARDAAQAAHADVLVQMAERQRAEAALHQVQRVEALGQLTGGVAHDFNNLLTVVLGNTELIRSSPTAAPFAARLNAIRGAAERGANLTGQMLAFARRQPLMPRAVDINALISAMRPLLESAVGPDVRLHFTLAPALEPARVDPTQIELVILNLAINARDAMPQGGSLHITTDMQIVDLDCHPADLPTGRYIAVSVRDTGTGMSPETLARAFEPFFTTKGPGGGSGLGLSQAYGVVRQSGGSARIESTEGDGTLVQIFLPRVTAETSAAAAP